MALINPPGLYSEGRVNLNPLPYLHYAMQAKAHKQAKDEALDKYFGNLPNTINEKGLRDQEVPILHKQKDDIQQYWMQNRDAIKKGNTPEAFNIGKMFRDAQGTTTTSINETAKLAKLSKLLTDPKTSYVRKDPNLMEAIRRSELPVNDPDFQSLDVDKFSIPPPPFEPNKYFSGYKDVKYDTKQLPPENIPGDKFHQTVTTIPSLGEDTKMAIYQRAGQLIDNPAFEDHIKKQLDSDPQLIGRLHDVFKQTYGRDIDPQLAEHDMAAAYTLAGLLPQPKKETRVKNQDAYNAEWDRRHAISFKDSMAKIAANKKAGTAAESLGYLSDEVASEVGKVLDVRMKDSQNPEKKTVVFVDDVDPDRMNIINADGEVEPDIIRVPNADGTMTVKEGYYVDPNTGDWIGKDGKTSSREATKDRYIKKYAPTKVKIQSGTKASENTNKQKPVVHEGYSRKDLLANGWTEDKIKKAVKAGKLKLND